MRWPARRIDQVVSQQRLLDHERYLDLTLPGRRFSGGRTGSSHRWLIASAAVEAVSHGNTALMSGQNGDRLRCIRIATTTTFLHQLR